MPTDDQQLLTRISEALQKNNAGTIVLSMNPSIDSVAAATALYLVLLKQNKNISLACSSSVNYDLVASDKIQSKLASGGDNLVISFPYADGAIDKVDYNIEGENFNLIISPRPNFPKLKPEQVKYSYSGGVVNFIIVIDSPSLQSLGALYNENKPQFQGKEIINLDRHLTNMSFGSINYVDKSSSSVSELVLGVIRNLNVEIDKDIATNLYAGIAAATNNFSSYSVNANTFESAAFLLKSGALKKLLKKPVIATSSYQVRPQSQVNKSSFKSQLPNIIPQNNKPIENVEKEPEDEEKNPPTDWLKPKIFRGGGLI